MAAAQLTPGAVAAMCEHAEGERSLGSLKPVLQVVDVRRVSNSQIAAERFRMLLSDGVHTLQSMLATAENYRIKHGEIGKGTIIHLLEFTCSTIRSRRITIVIKLDILQSECAIIGHPKPYESRNLPKEQCPNLPAAAAPTYGGTPVAVTDFAPRVTDFAAVFGEKATRPTVPSSLVPQFTDLEKKLQDPCPMPLSLPLRFLEVVTCDLSKEREVGRGGYGVVYMGLLTNGKKIAVKKLLEINLDDEQFQNEVTHLMGVKHRNIVQLIGYCAESRWEATLFKGKHVLAEIPKRLICFEYLNNSNVRTHLSDPSCGLEWEVRYKIIKEICLALDYLHSECNIVHLDLKPENILLDTDFAPKVADFGISRLFGQHQSRIITATRWGTLGYMAPEYIRNGVITTKADMFSFGTIIIELMTGSRDYPVSPEAYECFIQNVTGKWMARWNKTMSYIRPEIYSQQVKQCIIAGLNCINPDPEERPSASDVIEMLNTVDTMEL